MADLFCDPSEPILVQRGYSAWAMLPSLLVCVVVSGLFLLSGRWIDGVRGLGQDSGSWIFFLLTGLFWAVQIFRWLYRGSTYVYSLTAKHLFLDRGFRWLPIAPIDLTQVVSVTWGSHFLAKPFRVGWIEIMTREGRVERLRGVLNPQEFADAVRKIVSGSPQGDS
jgi:hypothetical protein